VSTTSPRLPAVRPKRPKRARRPKRSVQKAGPSEEHEDCSNPFDGPGGFWAVAKITNGRLPNGEIETNLAFMRVDMEKPPCDVASVPVGGTLTIRGHKLAMSK